jgi:hypothetical protein
MGGLVGAGVDFLVRPPGSRIAVPIQVSLPPDPVKSNTVARPTPRIASVKSAPRMMVTASFQGGVVIFRRLCWLIRNQFQHCVAGRAMTGLRHRTAAFRSGEH